MHNIHVGIEQPFGKRLPSSGGPGARPMAAVLYSGSGPRRRERFCKMLGRETLRAVAWLSIISKDGFWVI